MAFKKISDVAINRVIDKYGENSTEHQVITLVNTARIPYEYIADLMKCNTEQVRQDITGTFRMEEKNHAVMVRFLTTILPLGLERGVLPVKDGNLVAPILRLLIELCGHKQVISNLQTQIATLQTNDKN